MTPSGEITPKLGPKPGPAQGAQDIRPECGQDCRWHVYLLACADGTYYCGVTTDIERRLAQHNGQQPGGARYTRTRRPVRLLASMACDSRSAAQSVEWRVKHTPRDKKLACFSGGYL